MQHIVRRLNFVLILFVTLSAAAQSGDFRVLRTYELGGEGGWDYLRVDPASNRLFIARSTRVMVVDTSSGKLLGEVPGTEGVHGTALVPELKKGFTSNGRADSVTEFDLDSLKPIAQIKAGTRPDAITYDPASRRIFTCNAQSHDATAIDADTGKVAGTVPLNGKPEEAVADGNGALFVNLEDKNELVEVDTKKLAIRHTWPLTGCEGPTGISMDAEHHRVFVGCSNEKLVVVDALSGRVVASLPIGAGVDGTAFDPGLQLVFASAGSGTLSIYHEDTPDKYTLKQDLATARGARTMALDPQSHTVYLVTGRSPSGQPAPFKMLVVGR